MNSRLISLSILGSFLVCQNGFAGKEKENELDTFLQKVAPASWKDLNPKEKEGMLTKSKAELQKIFIQKSQKHLDRIEMLKALWPREFASGQDFQFIEVHTNNEGSQTIKTHLKGTRSKDFLLQNEETERKLSQILQELNVPITEETKRKLSNGYKGINFPINDKIKAKIGNVLECIHKKLPMLDTKENEIVRYLESVSSILPPETKKLDEEYNSILKNSLGKYASFLKMYEGDNAYRHAGYKHDFFKNLAAILDKTPVDKLAFIEVKEKNPSLEPVENKQWKKEVSLLKEYLVNNVKAVAEEGLKEINAPIRDMALDFFINQSGGFLGSYKPQVVVQNKAAYRSFSPIDLEPAKENLVNINNAAAEKWKQRMQLLDTPLARMARDADEEPASQPSSPQESPRPLSGTDTPK